MSSLLNGISDFCGCLLVILVLVVLVATKPNEEAHRAAIAQKTPVFYAVANAVELVGGGRELEYHDYLIFSLITTKSSKDSAGLPISIGVFGKVYYGKDK
jgi:hypothetical protein